MRIGWQAVVVIGVIALAVGAYAVWAGQNEMSYIKSCEQVVACGGIGAKAAPQFFLTAAQEASLQQAQLEWVAGIVVGVAGVACIVYGTYLHPERRGQALVTGPSTASAQPQKAQ